MIAADADIHPEARVYQPQLVNLYGCRIGARTKVGAFVEVQAGVVVGADVKIQAFAFLPSGVIIEDGVFIGPHVCFTNDRYPAACRPDGSLKEAADWRQEPTLVRAGASIGANATILCGLTIGRGALVAAGAVVTRDVPDHALVAGVPARVVGDVRGAGARAGAAVYP